jgi:PAS domain S-box-containing protein
MAVPGERADLVAQAERVMRGEDGPLHLVTTLDRGARSPVVDVFLAYGSVSDHPAAVVLLAGALREAEGALRRSEERLRGFVELISDPVWIGDREAVRYGNPAALRLFGFHSLEHALSTKPRELVHPDDAAMYEERENTILTEQRSLPPFEYRARCADGSTKIVEVSAIPMEWEGRPALLAFGRDLTERKQAEAAALQADRLAVLGMLAGGLAHSMNNPLSYVLLDLARAAECLPSLLEMPERREDVCARLSEAHDGALKVARVVQRMRLLSRVDDEKRGAVDVRAVLDLVVEVLRNEILHRGELSTEVAEGTPAVAASRGRLEQILLNLLIHALQALPESGDGRVRVKVRGEDEHVLIEVIYGPPRAGSDAPTTPSAGLPRTLSLAVGRNIVESLEGRVSVDATLDGYTVVSVRLPGAVQSSSAPPQRTSSRLSAEPPSVRAARVLVIDDDVAVGTALGLMLAPDHSVEYERDPGAALQRLLAGDHYDIVFCDVIMPGIGVEKLYQKIADCDPSLASRFVFMTGGAYTDAARSFLRGVTNPRIEKPFDLAQVRALVQQRTGRT